MNNKVSLLIRRLTALALVASPLCASHGQEVYSQIVGAMAVDVPSESDVVISPAFSRSAVHRGQLSAAATGSATFSSADFSGMDLSGYKLLVESGSLAGRSFDIVSDDDTATVTVADTGSELASASGATAAVMPSLTLDYLFPNGVAGHAETNPGDPDVLVFFNDNSQSTDGFYPEAFYYFYGSAWRKVGVGFGESDPTFGDAGVELGEGVVVRNNGDDPVTLYLYGELLEGDVMVPVVSKASDSVDNLLGLPRPLDVKLSAIGLAGSAAFATTTDPANPEDVLLVYENGSSTGKNPSPSSQYYHDGTNWRDLADNTVADDDVITAASALVLRKAPSSDSVVYWSSTWDTTGLDI